METLLYYYIKRVATRITNDNSGSMLSSTTLHENEIDRRKGDYERRYSITILFIGPTPFLFFQPSLSRQERPEKSVLQHEGNIIGGYTGRRTDGQTDRGCREYERGERYPGRSLR